MYNLYWGNGHERSTYGLPEPLGLDGAMPAARGTNAPYEMQRLIRQRKKDDFLDLKRGSLYNSIARAQRAGLIEPVQTTREGPAARAHPSIA